MMSFEMFIYGVITVIFMVAMNIAAFQYLNTVIKEKLECDKMEQKGVK